MMKKLLPILFGIIFCFASSVRAEELKAGKKTPVNETTWFVYQFTERPKVGDVIMKVTISDQETRPIKVFAHYDMPSMRGHHDSGKVEFKRNRTQDYVLPIHFAMPGEWEIILTFEENGQEIYQGAVNLEI
ncbi:MAG: FixH family protein [Alphaproteobacteria bacterium]|nr:FixH family protein [Alphaproteobacteria bacterium]